MTSSEKISFTYNQAIDLVTKELENTKIGQDAGTSITGERNIILGKDTAFNCIDINDSIVIGYRYGFNLIESSSNLVYIVNNGIGGDERLVSDNNSIMIGSLIGNKLIYNNNNNINYINKGFELTPIGTMVLVRRTNRRFCVPIGLIPTYTLIYVTLVHLRPSRLVAHES